MVFYACKCACVFMKALYIHMYIYTCINAYINLMDAYMCIRKKQDWIYTYIYMYKLHIYVYV